MTEPVKSYLLVINDAPLDGERPYNAMRLAVKLVRQPGVRLRLFLLGDGVQCALAGQDASEDSARIERMLSSLAKRGEVAT
jgi:sulfur relay (sulfurtransferase) complex TusBCD TusD component (DsrE family)